MDSKEDDEISIDFGKIKNFFKSKDEEKKPEEAAKSDDKGNKNETAKSDAEDEDISLDLGKIKGFFKSEKKEEKETRHAEHKKEDNEELSLDFSKIKNIFKSEKKEASSSDDEMSFDMGKAVDFFKKYGIVLIALMPIILSIYVRLQAGFLPITDEWATNTIMNNLRSQMRSGIDQQYPNLPDANKNTLVDAELKKMISQNKAQIDEQIKQTSSYFKSFFQDENGNNYMPDIDPYYWVRYADNILKNGHPGDILKDGRPFDNHQLAPVGRFVTFDLFHSYALAYFYKILSFFSSGLTLIRSSFYLPVFISAICVLIVFLIARKIAGNAAGFFAGMIMAVNGAFLGRTLFGHADNDGWVIFFPLLATWLFVTTEDAKSPIIVIILGSLAGFFTGIFTFAWSGWWFIFDFLLVTIAITLAYLVLVNFNEIRKNKWSMVSDVGIRNMLIFGIIYFLSTAVFATLFSGWQQFRNSFLGPLSFPSIKAPVLTSVLWPNVLTTVAELNEGSINGIINSVGGPFLFFISLTGLILAVSIKEGYLKKFDVLYWMATLLFYWSYFLLRKTFSISVFGLIIWIMLPIAVRILISIYKKNKSHDFKSSILLSLWIASTIFASIKGIRFTLLLAPAFSVAFGVAFGKIYEYMSGTLTKGLKIHKAISSGILIIVLLSVYVSPTRAAIRSAGQDIPIINDAWYNTLIAIKKDSKPDAIITSWWDFGHHFKYIADRPVTFDGTTQTSQPAHWVGKLFMTDSEQQAFGILRMLDCGSGRAFNTLNGFLDNNHLTLKIINKIILLDKEYAENELSKYNLDEKQINDVLQYTHCRPPEGYVIASEDMIGKSGVWSHFGSWNFERADLWQNVRGMPQEQAVQYMTNKFNYTRDRAENTYFEIQAIGSDSEANTWVAPWPGYGGEMTCRKNKEGLFVCSPLNVGNNVALVFNINLTDYDVYARFQDKLFKPSSAAFVTEDGVLFKKRFDDATTGHGMTIVPQSKDEIKVIISSSELAGSIFTRMFYMQGHGLRYFDLFDHQRGLTGTDIYTYKVDWEGKNATIVKDYDDFLKEPIEEVEDTALTAQSNLTEENMSASNNSQ